MRDLLGQLRHTLLLINILQSQHVFVSVDEGVEELVPLPQPRLLSGLDIVGSVRDMLLQEILHNAMLFPDLGKGTPVHRLALVNH